MGDITLRQSRRLGGWKLNRQPDERNENRSRRSSGRSRRVDSNLFASSQSDIGLGIVSTANAPDVIVPGDRIMQSRASFNAKTHFQEILITAEDRLKKTVAVHVLDRALRSGAIDKLPPTRSS
jgi:hypothetical protein